MAERQSDAPSKALRHVVLFAFKVSSTPQQIREIERAFRELPSKIDAIHGFEWGTDISVENLSQGYTHCFLVTFLSEEGRNTYLTHPAHREFVTVLESHLEKALVFDYWLRE